MDNTPPSSVRTAWKWLGHFHSHRWQPLRDNPDFKNRWDAIDYLANYIWGRSWMAEHDARVQATLDKPDTFVGWDQDRARRYAARQHTIWMIDDAVKYLRSHDYPPLS